MRHFHAILISQQDRWIGGRGAGVKKQRLIFRSRYYPLLAAATIQTPIPFLADILTPNQLAKIDMGAAVTTVSAMVGVRLVPVIAFNLVNYGAGLTNVSWWRFTWTTAIGILPLTFLMAMIGDQMRAPAFTDWMMLLGAGVLMLAVVHLARRFGVVGSDK